METEIVNIPVGYDLFRAEVLEAACTDAGIRVRLVPNEHPETGGLVALQPSHLLVNAEDAQQIRTIVARNYASGIESGDQ